MVFDVLIISDIPGAVGVKIFISEDHTVITSRYTCYDCGLYAELDAMVKHPL